jgi:tetratricopeptide (TPR) repeat protein
VIGTSMQAAGEHARRAGEARLATEADFWIAFAAFFGETPLSEAWAIWEQVNSRALTPLQQTHAEFWRGCLEGYGGNFDAGLAAIAHARSRYAELGLRAYYGGSANPHAELEILAGDPVAAEQTLQEALVVLEQLGDRSYRSTLLMQLAEALLEQRRLDAAEDVLTQAESLSAPDDAINVAGFPTLRAKLLAARGRPAEAEPFAREGVAKALLLTGHLRQIAYAHEALAAVLRLTGRNAEARQEAELALELYERKEIAPAVEQVRSFLAELVAK